MRSESRFGKFSILKSEFLWNNEEIWKNLNVQPKNLNFFVTIAEMNDVWRKKSQFRNLNFFVIITAEKSEAEKRKSLRFCHQSADRRRRMLSN